ncbi:MAG TPA: ABC transporter permease [Acidobacteriota bacterium]|nr:ABC transporter permease [Acidobacteriota bacterium]
MIAWIWRDIRFGLRMMLKYPTLSIVAVLIFGLGIGLTASVFSVVNGAFFKGLPLEEADRLVVLWNTNPARHELDMPVRVHDYLAFRERQTTFEDIGFFTVSPMNLATDLSQPERLTGAQISANSFAILRVKPMWGRTFRAGEGRPGADPVVIISYNVWRNHFGSSRDALGKAVRVNGVTRTVVGVMPEQFAFPAFENIWIPHDLEPVPAGREQAPSYQLFGRLKHGVAYEEATAQAIAIAAALEQQYPQTNRGISATIRPYSETFIMPQMRALLYTMLAAGIGVLIIACVNVANLLLARTSMRGREFAIRMAIGAGRARILVQLLVEALVLAVAGGLVGFWFSSATMGWFISVLAHNPPPFWITFELDHRVLLFVTGITLAAGLFAGLIPAWRIGKTNTIDALKDESRTSKSPRAVRLSSTLVVAEVAISCALLIASGHLIRSIVNLKTIKMPFAIDRMLTARINLTRADYPDAASRLRFCGQLLVKLRSLPGVEAVGLSDALPAAGNGDVSFQVEGQANLRVDDCPKAKKGEVSPEYFQMFQTPLLQGREFTELDQPGTPLVAVVNESLARNFFPGGDVVGKRLRIMRADSPSPWLVVVGIVPDLFMEGFGNTHRTPAGFYLPLSQSDVGTSLSMTLRTRAEPTGMTREVRSAVSSLNPDLPVFSAMSMKEVIARQIWFHTVIGTFFLALGFSALVLAVAGLYAVMCFTVTQRTRELSIRAALGAQRGQLVRLVMGRGVTQLAVGTGMGLGLGLLMVAPLQSFLVGVKPRDPVLVMTVLAALLAAGLLANLIPAKRITKIHVAAALSAE